MHMWHTIWKLNIFIITHFINLGLVYWILWTYVRLLSAIPHIFIYNTANFHTGNCCCRFTEPPQLLFFYSITLHMASLVLSRCITYATHITSWVWVYILGYPGSHSMTGVTWYSHLPRVAAHSSSGGATVSHFSFCLSNSYFSRSCHLPQDKCVPCGILFAFPTFHHFTFSLTVTLST